MAIANIPSIDAKPTLADEELVQDSEIGNG